jgi:enoyl-CoA hydratase/carnithine racemase
MIEVESRDGVSILRMAADDNRFSHQLVLSLETALEGLEPSQKPLIITGTQKYFSNGLDLQALSEHGEPLLQRIYRLLGRLVTYPGATLAAINGHAFGAGAMLAAACDFRCMREDRGYFCFPEVDLGLPMSAPFDALCQAKYSRAALCEAWITGRRYTGSEALRAGFVDSVASETELLDRASAQLAPLAGKSGAAVRSLKRTLFASAVAQLEHPTHATA